MCYIISFLWISHKYWLSWPRWLVIALMNPESFQDTLCQLITFLSLTHVMPRIPQLGFPVRLPSINVTELVGETGSYMKITNYLLYPKPTGLCQTYLQYWLFFVIDHQSWPNFKVGHNLFLLCCWGNGSCNLTHWCIPPGYFWLLVTSDHALL